MANILFHWLSTGIVALLHPFFVAVIEINHNPKDATVEISVRAFAEDIEKAVQKYTTKKIDLLSPADPVFLDSQIGSYVNQKLRLKVNGQAVALKYLGHELQKESIWMYLEVPKVADMSSLELDCKLLYDLEVSQTNLVHVKSKGISRNYKLDYPKNMALFNF